MTDSQIDPNSIQRSTYYSKLMLSKSIFRLGWSLSLPGGCLFGDSCNELTDFPNA